MKYQKTVKCKLFVTKSGMWVEISGKNSKSDILFCFKFSQIRWFYGSVIAGVLTYVTITTFWLVSSFFSLEVEKLFQHNILKIIDRNYFFQGCKIWCYIYLSLSKGTTLFLCCFTDHFVLNLLKSSWTID